MDENSTFKKYLFPFLLMMLVGWGGLVVLMTYTLPFVWARWAFYFLLTIALTASALPATYFLNLRFPSDPPVGTEVILRQALWVGIYGAALVWIWKFLTIQMAVGLAGGFILIEWLIRLRERSRFQPKAVQEFSPVEDSGNKS